MAPDAAAYNAIPIPPEVKAEKKKADQAYANLGVPVPESRPEREKTPAKSPTRDQSPAGSGKGKDTKGKGKKGAKGKGKKGEKGPKGKGKGKGDKNKNSQGRKGHANVWSEDQGGWTDDSWWVEDQWGEDAQYDQQNQQPLRQLPQIQLTNQQGYWDDNQQFIPTVAPPGPLIGALTQQHIQQNAQANALLHQQQQAQHQQRQNANPAGVLVQPQLQFGPGRLAGVSSKGIAAATAALADVNTRTGDPSHEFDAGATVFVPQKR